MYQALPQLFLHEFKGHTIIARKGGSLGTRLVMMHVDFVKMHVDFVKMHVDIVMMHVVVILIMKYIALH